MPEIPLDPANGGRSIMPNSLKEGDIVVSTTSSLVSQVIRAVSAGAISHAALYVGTGFTGTPAVIQAIRDGVVLTELDEALEDDTVAVGFRHPQMTVDSASLITAFAQSQLGKRYDAWRAIIDGVFRLVGVRRKVNFGTGKSKFFCSQLVALAYRTVEWILH